ncbi:hypothetical protein U1E44_10630 [Arenibacter sp. GZD96]|uniref:hypothetical protein n=1 Tax=Aurantibrevibacter litoralis TaxID=3106030 RepID=UPI002AFF0828|nr:hypothetical protein [Arenibacter sp. GZD-96]MEA1786547.1 hypothetical protein [Arenibacter sp. GZD-96]
MKKRTKKENVTTGRRKFFPILGTGLLLPLMGFGKPLPTPLEEPEDAYQTLLKPDGTTVKVKKSVVAKAKVVEKNISNISFLKWLNKAK